MKALKITIFFVAVAMGAAAQNAGDTLKKSAADSVTMLSGVQVLGVAGSVELWANPLPTTVISSHDLQMISATNVIDAVSDFPGIAQITTGSGISKPVIRGMGYNRVLVVNDGIRQEGQQWGDEHGVEIDDAGVHSVEVIKGPASLLYGSDALAGVLILRDPPHVYAGRMKIDLLGGYQSNANLWNYSLNVAGNQKRFVWDARWSQKQASEYSNKVNGKVANSQFAEQAFKGMVGYHGDRVYSHLKFTYYHLKPGIVEAEEEAEGEEVPAESPFQQIRHYKVVSDNQINLRNHGFLKILLAYQQNRRQEFEEPNEPGLDFQLHTANYDVRYVPLEMRGWKCNFGVNGMWQTSRNLGSEFLIPAYNLFDAGVFATTTKTLVRKLHLSGGVRFDLRYLHSFALYDDGNERFTDFSRIFPGVSGSVGLSYVILPNLAVKFNVARGFRAPNISELGSNGEHEGTLRYEVGNSDLKSEGSWQLDLGLEFASRVVDFQMSLFTNWVNHYIFLEKRGDVIDEKPVYQFVQGNARLMGGEAAIVLHPVKGLELESSFSYVNAQQLHRAADSKYLPFTPEPRWLSTLRYVFPLPEKVVRNFYIEAQVDCHLAQNNVRLINDTETRTPSYTLLNSSLGADFYAKNRHILSVHFCAHNILNRAYYSHLSRLKEGGIYDMGRNFCVKVLVPVVFFIDKEAKKYTTIY